MSQTRRAPLSPSSPPLLLPHHAARIARSHVLGLGLDLSSNPMSSSSRWWRWASPSSPWHRKGGGWGLGGPVVVKAIGWLLLAGLSFRVLCSFSSSSSPTAPEIKEGAGFLCYFRTCLTLSSNFGYKGWGIGRVYLVAGGGGGGQGEMLRCCVVGRLREEIGCLIEVWIFVVLIWFPAMACNFICQFRRGEKIGAFLGGEIGVWFIIFLGKRYFRRFEREKLETRELFAEKKMEQFAALDLTFV